MLSFKDVFILPQFPFETILLEQDHVNDASESFIKMKCIEIQKGYETANFHGFTQALYDLASVVCDAFKSNIEDKFNFDFIIKTFLQCSIFQILLTILDDNINQMRPLILWFIAVFTQSSSFCSVFMKEDIITRISVIMTSNPDISPALFRNCLSAFINLVYYAPFGVHLNHLIDTLPKIVDQTMEHGIFNHKKISHLICSIYKKQIVPLDFATSYFQNLMETFFSDPNLYGLDLISIANQLIKFIKSTLISKELEDLNTSPEYELINTILSNEYFISTFEAIFPYPNNVSDVDKYQLIIFIGNVFSTGKQEIINPFLLSFHFELLGNELRHSDSVLTEAILDLYIKMIPEYSEQVVQGFSNISGMVAEISDLLDSEYKIKFKTIQLISKIEDCVIDKSANALYNFRNAIISSENLLDTLLGFLEEGEKIQKLEVIKLITILTSNCNSCNRTVDTFIQNLMSEGILDILSEINNDENFKSNLTETEVQEFDKALKHLFLQLRKNEF